jgi:hypothetical protein
VIFGHLGLAKSRAWLAQRGFIKKVIKIFCLISQHLRTRHMGMRELGRTRMAHIWTSRRGFRWKLMGTNRNMICQRIYNIKHKYNFSLILFFFRFSIASSRPSRGATQFWSMDFRLQSD